MTFPPPKLPDIDWDKIVEAGRILDKIPGKREGYARIEVLGFVAEARAATQEEAARLMLEQLKQQFRRDWRLVDTDGTVIADTTQERKP